MKSSDTENVVKGACLCSFLGCKNPALYTKYIINTSLLQYTYIKIGKTTKNRKYVIYERKYLHFVNILHAITKNKMVKLVRIARFAVFKKEHGDFLKTVKISSRDYYFLKCL